MRRVKTRSVGAGLLLVLLSVKAGCATKQPEGETEEAAAVLGVDDIDGGVRPHPRGVVGERGGHQALLRLLYSTLNASTQAASAAMTATVSTSMSERA